MNGIHTEVFVLLKHEEGSVELLSVHSSFRMAFLEGQLRAEECSSTGQIAMRVMTVDPLSSDDTGAIIKTFYRPIPEEDREYLAETADPFDGITGDEDAE